ncbi:MAG: FAD-binding oxidoreductase [Pseudomonadota bacterium]
MTRSVIVVGAGMVGVSAALHLQERGLNVTLIDRRGPGEETSYGNAGVIIGGIDIPVGIPRDLGELARLALNRTTYMQYRPSLLPKLAPWLWAFWRASSPERLEASARATQPLFSHAISTHKSFASAAKADDLLRDDGWVQIFRTATGINATDQERRLAQEYGVDVDVLDPDSLADLEPSLKPVAAAALHWKNITSTSDPGRLTKAYATLFSGRGGTIIEADVDALLNQSNGRWHVLTGTGAIEADDVVVAAGPWSPDLLAPLGYKLPFAVKRGYHWHYKPFGNAGLARPVVDSDYGFVLAPMEQGIRITTGVEFDDRDAPPNRAQLDAVLPHARDLFPLDGPAEDEPWLGRRPCFPDQLPMIGSAPRHKGLWFDFGHAHWGLTLGPASGLLLADLMTGATPYADPTPFAPTRYKI